MASSYVRKIQSEVCREIIDLINNNQDEWMQRWVETPSCQNGVSGHEYSGANIWATSITMWKYGLTDPRFLTFNQVQQLGGKVKKGTSTPIFFYKPIKNEDTDERGTIQRVYNAFNVELVEGINLSDLKPISLPSDQNTIVGAGSEDQVDAYVRNTSAKIRNSQTGAFYAPIDDAIFMPSKSRFLGDGDYATVSYYSTLLHELVHWTGSVKRLNRDSIKEYNKKREVRAKEELIAEIGAAMLCKRFALTTKVRPDHASYIKGWISLLNDSPYELFRASAASKAAVTYLDDLQGDMTCPTLITPSAINAVTHHSTLQ